MKVKIGNTVYDPSETPIMVVLSEADKKNISTMSEDNTKYCVYPSTEEWIANGAKKIKTWMEEIDTAPNRKPTVDRCKAEIDELLKRYNCKIEVLGEQTIHTAAVLVDKTYKLFRKL